MPLSTCFSACNNSQRKQERRNDSESRGARIPSLFECLNDDDGMVDQTAEIALSERPYELKRLACERTRLPIDVVRLLKEYEELCRETASDAKRASELQEEVADLHAYRDMLVREKAYKKYEHRYRTDEIEALGLVIKQGKADLKNWSRSPERLTPRIANPSPLCSQVTTTPAIPRGDHPPESRRHQKPMQSTELYDGTEDSQYWIRHSSQLPTLTHNHTRPIETSPASSIYDHPTSRVNGDPVQRDPLPKFYTGSQRFDRGGMLPILPDRYAAGMVRTWNQMGHQVSNLAELWRVVRDHCSKGSHLNELRLRAKSEPGNKRGDIVGVIATPVQEFSSAVSVPQRYVTLPQLWSFQCRPPNILVYAVDDDRIRLATESTYGAIIVGQNVVVVSLQNSGGVRDASSFINGMTVYRITQENIGDLVIQSLLSSFGSRLSPGLCGTDQFRKMAEGFPLRLRSDGQQFLVACVTNVSDIRSWRPTISVDGTAQVTGGSFANTLKRLTKSLENKRDILGMVPQYLNAIGGGVCCSTKEEKSALDKQVNDLKLLIDSREDLQRLGLFHS